MEFIGVKSLSLPYAINRALRKSRNREGNVKYTVANSFLFLFTADGNPRKFEEVMLLKEKLQEDGKNVSILYLLLNEEHKPDGALDDHMVKFDKKDIGLFGNIKDEYVSEILSRNYDFVINVDLHPNIYCDYLMAKCKSNCKIGHYFADHDKFYDMMIQTADDTDEEFYLNQVYHYIKQL